MFNQSFSKENFRVIMDIENRKGPYIEEQLGIQSIISINRKIARANYLIKQAHSKNKKHINKLILLKNKYKSDRESVIDLELTKIENHVHSKSYNIELEEGWAKKKRIYKWGNSDDQIINKCSHYFVSKQLYYNIKNAYGIVSQKRDCIVGELVEIIGPNPPVEVIRLDIKEFYESIPFNRVIDDMMKDGLLTHDSMNIIYKIYNQYRVMSNADKGLPRGINISTLLAEIYLRDVDRILKNMQDIVYYGRYVDDIILVFNSDEVKSKVDNVKDVIRDYSLTVSSKKLMSRIYSQSRSAPAFDYLGYSIKVKNGKRGYSKVDVLLSDKKILKYKNRINVMLKSYLLMSFNNEKKARALLYKRLRFLCGNTRLFKNKKHILVGVYYSNKSITDGNQFDGLDNYLHKAAVRCIKNKNIVEKIKCYSFANAFKNPSESFSSFKPEELIEVMRVWK